MKVNGSSTNGEVTGSGLPSLLGPDRAAPTSTDSESFGEFGRMGPRPARKRAIVFDDVLADVQQTTLSQPPTPSLLPTLFQQTTPLQLPTSLSQATATPALVDASMDQALVAVTSINSEPQETPLIASLPINADQWAMSNLQTTTPSSVTELPLPEPMQHRTLESLPTISETPADTSTSERLQVADFSTSNATSFEQSPSPAITTVSHADRTLELSKFAEEPVTQPSSVSQGSMSGVRRMLQSRFTQPTSNTDQLAATAQEFGRVPGLHESLGSEGIAPSSDLSNRSPFVESKSAVSQHDRRVHSESQDQTATSEVTLPNAELSRELPTTVVATPATLTEQIAASAAAHQDELQQGQPIEIHLRLDPPELGTVRVHLRMVGDTVTIRFDGTSESVTRTLESQLPDLRQSLAERGLVFDQGGAMNHHSAQQQQQSFNFNTTERRANLRTQTRWQTVGPVASTHRRTGQSAVWA